MILNDLVSKFWLFAFNANDDSPTIFPPKVVVNPVNWGLISSINKTLFVIHCVNEVTFWELRLINLDTDSVVVSSDPRSKLNFVYIDNKDWILTNVPTSLEAIETLIGIISIALIGLITSRSEKFLNPATWINEFTGSCHVEIGVLLLIEYEKFW